MIKANFNTYASYVTDSLHQWDLNQVLKVTGLNLSVKPEVHFSNSKMNGAIVRQANMTNHVVEVDIPNSLLQDPLTINAHIGIYEGDTFKVIELVQIPVIPRKRPYDYQIEDSDEEIYSFKELKNMIQNIDEKWSDFTTEKVDSAVKVWLEDHPEATTTVQDGALTEAKFSEDLKLHTLKDYVTPEMFGAKGDGVTDDTEALKRCLRNDVIILLKGTYLISECLNFSHLKNVTLSGGKITREKDQTFCTIKGGKCSNIHIINVEFDGNGNTNDIEYSWSDNIQACIIIAGDCDNIFVEKCKIKNHYYGVFTLGAELENTHYSINATVRDCEFDNCYVGVDTYGKNILIDHNAFLNITGSAVQIEPEGEPSVDNPLADPMYYQCAMSCVIANNMFANIDETAIIIHDNVYGVKIDNNTIVNFKQGINSNRSFKGCFVTNNTLIYQKDYEINTDKRPWDLTYFAIYCGENTHIVGNYLEKCVTAIIGSKGSIIKNNEIISPLVSAIAVSTSDLSLVHDISGNIIRDFVKNAESWWGAYPIVNNVGKALICNNIVYSDVEPILNVDGQATVKNLYSSTAQKTAITPMTDYIYSN